MHLVLLVPLRWPHPGSTFLLNLRRTRVKNSSHVCRCAPKIWFWISGFAFWVVVYDGFNWNYYTPKIHCHHVEKLRCLGISRYKFKMRFCLDARRWRGKPLEGEASRLPPHTHTRMLPRATQSSEPSDAIFPLFPGPQVWVEDAIKWDHQALSAVYYHTHPHTHTRTFKFESYLLHVDYLNRPSS